MEMVAEPLAAENSSSSIVRLRGERSFPASDPSANWSQDRWTKLICRRIRTSYVARGGACRTPAFASFLRNGQQQAGAATRRRNTAVLLLPLLAIALLILGLPASALTGSPVTLVGAMVLSLESGPVAAIAVGAVRAAPTWCDGGAGPGPVTRADRVARGLLLAVPTSSLARY
jgi:hypothetical protein